MESILKSQIGPSEVVRVLLFVTTRRRDLFPMKRLADELAGREGYAVRLCGMTDFHFAILDFAILNFLLLDFGNFEKKHEELYRDN